MTALLLTAGASLRLLGLQLRSLWFDEAATLVVARAPLTPARSSAGTTR